MRVRKASPYVYEANVVHAYIHVVGKTLHAKNNEQTVQHVWFIHVSDRLGDRFTLKVEGELYTDLHEGQKVSLPYTKHLGNAFAACPCFGDIYTSWQMHVQLNAYAMNMTCTCDVLYRPLCRRKRCVWDWRCTLYIHALRMQLWVDFKHQLYALHECTHARTHARTALSKPVRPRYAVHCSSGRYYFTNAK